MASTRKRWISSSSTQPAAHWSSIWTASPTRLCSRPLPRPATSIENAVVSMYAKCHSLDDSRHCFREMAIKDVVSWNAIISGYAHHGQAREALLVYSEMLLEGGEPDAVTFSAALSACSGNRDLIRGRQLHARISAMGLDSSLILQNALVNFYGKCDDLERARTIFDKMKARDSGSWTALMGAYTQSGRGMLALTLFQLMNLEGTDPDAFTFIGVFGACSNVGVLDRSRGIHDRFLAMGFKHDVVTGTAAVTMFGKCRGVADAKSVFDGMRAKNSVTWNAMIGAYVQAGDDRSALELFRVMDVEPDVFTFSTVLSACSNLRSLEDGRGIYERVRADGKMDSDLVLRNALLNMFSKCGSLIEMRKIFESMENRDVVSWNAVIGAYVLHEQPAEALDLFEAMTIKPDAITFASALAACASLEAIDRGRQLHRLAIEDGFGSVTMVRNALVTMYGRCGSIGDAEMIFAATEIRDVVSYSALIAARAQHGQSSEAIKLHRRMNLEGIEADVFTFASLLGAIASPEHLPQGRNFHSLIVSRGFDRDTVVGTALVNMYARCGDLVTARINFDRLGSKNVVSWNAMIAGYVQAGSDEDALMLYEKMKSDAGARPDELTFASVLAACSGLGDVSRGMKLHEEIAAAGFAEDLIIQNALVDMYGKGGDLVECRGVFEGIKNKSVVSWTSMVTAYARHGYGFEAVELVWGMNLEGVEADDVTLTSMLQGCSHSGLVGVAGSLIGMMVRDQGIELTLEHKMCLVDLLGRVGWIKEAEEFIAKSEELKEEGVAWTSFLSACERQSERERGAKAAQEIWSWEQPRLSSSSFVMLSNI